MTNEELKKKIVEILEEGQTPVEYDDGDWGQTYFPTNEDVADALIAAGIGDVNEEKSKAFVYANEIAYLDNQLKEYKHRAEVAERAFLILWKECKEKLGWNIDCTMWYAKQAKKELAEERKE